MEAHIELTPSGCSLGAIVQGVQPDRLDDGALGTLLDMLHTHLVLVFRGHDPLTDDSLLSFAQRFGEPMRWFKKEERAPVNDSLMFVSNVVGQDGSRVGIVGNSELEWHANYSYQARVALYTILDAVTVPAEGGDTYFCNMYEAYVALSSDLRERLTGLKIHHGLRGSSDGGYISNFDELAGSPDGGLGVANDPRNPQAVHPIVRQHPVTGRHTLFDVGLLGNLAILGLPSDEGRALSQELYQHATQPRFVYRHHWQPGDLLIFDNIPTMHYREPFPEDVPRMIRRLDIAEDGISGYDPRAS